MSKTLFFNGIKWIELFYTLITLTGTWALPGPGRRTSCSPSPASSWPASGQSPCWSPPPPSSTPPPSATPVITWRQGKFKVPEVLINSLFTLYYALRLSDFLQNISADLPVWWSGLTATPACPCWIIITRFLNCPFLHSVSPQMPPTFKRLYCIVCFHCKLSNYFPFPWLL